MLATSQNLAGFSPEGRALLVAMLSAVVGSSRAPAGQAPAGASGGGIRGALFAPADLPGVLTGKTQSHPETSRAADDLLASSALMNKIRLSQTVLTQALSPASFKNLPLVLQRLFGPLSLVGGNSPWPVQMETLASLERSLSRLNVISPERASRALQTLSVLAQIGGRNLDAVLQQIGARLGTLSNALALKGGLPAHMREPSLPDSSILMMRFGNLSQDAFVNLVRALMQRDVAVIFAGRDSTGAVQIQIQIAEVPAGDLQQGTFQTQTPIRHAGLTTADVAGLREILFVDRLDGVELAGVRGQTVAQPATYTGENVVAAALRQALRPDAPAQVGSLITPTRAEGAAQYVFNYHLAVLFPWFDFSATASAFSHARTAADGGPVIPTFLDLIAGQPLMLPYYPDELLIPGTNIPLILLREE
jgi:hypothetical protein